MTFTYSGNPASSQTDEIRFFLQDTDQTDPLFQDEEIQYFATKMMSVNGSSVLTAAYLAEVAAGRFAREVAISADGVNVAAEALQGKYEDLAAQLRNMSSVVDGSGNGPIVGGIGDWTDWALPPKTFGRRLTDNMRAGQQDYGGYPDEFEHRWW